MSTPFKFLLATPNRPVLHLYPPSIILPPSSPPVPLAQHVRTPPRPAGVHEGRRRRGVDRGLGAEHLLRGLHMWVLLPVAVGGRDGRRRMQPARHRPRSARGCGSVVNHGMMGFRVRVLSLRSVLCLCAYSRRPVQHRASSL
ncbi:hypothetical protein GSI_05711 [Ganoderma sinense ZZ0214-1]|uniref:Uncharacterized protein n=1 Tax=Ganoderma sinense ZZ0214-1 TaxID=1077348 RepID=A0A2G8SB76_9APHY|nr:hypothetical protein GSI_05711 [Ganoderma sinense ZZ0214-1]